MVNLFEKILNKYKNRPLILCTHKISGLTLVSEFGVSFAEVPDVPDPA